MLEVLRGASYRDYVAHTELQLPYARDFRIEAAARETLLAFNEQARRDGVAVIATLPTLPTMFDDRAVEEGIRHRIAEMFRSQGQHFMELENLSQYPRPCFYDSMMHLHQSCQARHSKKLAEALAAHPAFLASASPRH